MKSLAEMIVEAIIAKEPLDRGGLDNRPLLKRLKERQSAELQEIAASRETLPTGENYEPQEISR